MTPAHFFTWQNWVLLVLNVAAESAVLWLALTRRFYKRLIMLPVYAAFLLLVDVAGTALAFVVKVDASSGRLWASRVYWEFYWTAQIAAGVLVLLLVLQIVTAVLPPWKNLITLVSAIMVVSLTVVLFTLVPLDKAGDALALVSMAGVIGVLSLPMIFIIRPAEWPRGIRFVVAGLILSTLLQVGCAIGAALLHTLSGLFNIGAPAASLVGMAFFLAAVLSSRTDGRTTGPRLAP